MTKKLVKKHDELSKKFLTNLDTAKEFLRLHLDPSLFVSTLSYLMNAKNRVELLPLFNKIIENFSEYKEDTMTYAEELRQEGEQKGKLEGKLECKQEMVQEMLKAGANLSFIKQVSHLSKEEIEKIEKSMH